MQIRNIHRHWLWLIILLFSISLSSFQYKKKNDVVIGYVGGYRGLVNTEAIDANKLTHINYAFVDIRGNRAWLHNEITDTTNLRELNLLKRINPELKILISIGGWSWSENFSDAVLTDTSRKGFVASAVAIVQQYDLDGIDIDWEYPGMQGEDNVFRPEDKEHYTLLFQELRVQLNQLKEQTHKRYFISTAAGGSQSFIEHTEMDKVQQYLDFVNLMTYDYRTEEDSISGHHTNLFLSRDKADEECADGSVQLYLAAGVPAEKIVLGIAFYGSGWTMASDDNHGLYRKAIAPARGGGYTRMKDSIINKNGYTRYWDNKAKAPYVFNSQNKVFISYDDEESVKCKCRYADKHKLAGVMFWEYFADPKGYLLNEINAELK